METLFFGMAVKFVKLDLIPLFIAIYILLTQWSATINRLLKSLENFYLIGFFANRHWAICGVVWSFTYATFTQKI